MKYSDPGSFFVLFLLTARTPPPLDTARDVLFCFYLSVLFFIIQCLIMSLGSQVEIRALSSPECTQVMFFLSPTWNLERLYWLGVKFVRTDWERAHWPRALLSAIVRLSLVHTHTHTHLFEHTWLRGKLLRPIAAADTFITRDINFGGKTGGRF